MKNHSGMLRALYIILVPMVLLMILLNTGWLQRFIPAVNVNGENYSVLRYNFYYYEAQMDYLHTHEQELDLLGYNTSLAPERQDYNDSMTWKEFFQNEAEANLARTAYYNALAEQAGYSFTEDELAPVAQRVEDHAANASDSGISTKNYYIAYYGSGMTEELYTEELTRAVKAQVYAQYLVDSYEPQEDALTRYLEENPAQDYASVQLQLVTLEALPDRATGEVGEPQLEALRTRLNALVQRYEGGTPVEVLQENFSTGGVGTVLLTRSTELPQALVTHFIDSQQMQDIASIDETCAFVDADTATAYFAVCLGYGDNGRAVDATAVLGQQALEQTEEACLSAYQPQHNSFGMLLAAS